MFLFYLARKRIGEYLTIEKACIGWMVAIVTYRALDNWIGLPNVLATPLVLDYAQLFIMGIMFYQFRQKGADKTSLGILLATLPLQYFAEGLESTFMAAGFMALFWLIIANRATVLANPLAVYIGSISYPLYLIHEALGYTVMEPLFQFTSSSVVLIIAPMLVAIGISHIITHRFERKTLKALRAWYEKMKTNQSGFRTRWFNSSWTS
jgi:peptidoglycan/LPS O-acetylase OafA/YrhL